MKRTFVITGLILGLLSVVLGAFGAHYVADRVSDASLAGFKTAVSYQVYHALLLLIIGFNLSHFKVNRHQTIFFSFLLGILCFSGSLYLLTTRSITGLSILKFLGPVTPIGGILLIIGWFTLIISLKRDSF